MTSEKRYGEAAWTLDAIIDLFPGSDALGGIARELRDVRAELVFATTRLHHAQTQLADLQNKTHTFKGRKP